MAALNLGIYGPLRIELTSKTHLPDKEPLFHVWNYVDPSFARSVTAKIQGHPRPSGAAPIIIEQALQQTRPKVGAVADQNRHLGQGGVEVVPIPKVRAHLTLALGNDPEFRDWQHFFDGPGKIVPVGAKPENYLQDCIDRAARYVTTEELEVAHFNIIEQGKSTNKVPAIFTLSVDFDPKRPY